MDFAKRMQHCSNCEIIIRQNGIPIKQPQKVKSFEDKLQQEIIENFTVLTFAVEDNTLIFNVK